MNIFSAWTTVPVKALLCLWAESGCTLPGHTDAAGPEQQRAHHRCVPSRHHFLLIPEARKRDEHRQRLPAFLSVVQAGGQELVHTGRHYLHQSHRGPHWPLGFQELLHHSRSFIPWRLFGHVSLHVLSRHKRCTAA